MWGKGPWANFAPEPVSQETMPPRRAFVPDQRQSNVLAFFDAVLDQVDAELAALRAAKEEGTK